MEMSEADWYEITQGSALLQGDILFRCPVFLAARELQWPLAADAEVGVRVRVFDLVVMTQSCDLENDKLEDILLAQVVAWPDAVRDEVGRGNEAVRGSKFRKLLVDGSIPGLSLLHKREELPRLPWSVVDFRHLFTLSKTFLRPFAASSGHRLRLRSLYREHLAQAFARYFMRVGLPHDARAFEKEGDVKI
jgi:hypothetical protein